MFRPEMHFADANRLHMNVNSQKKKDGRNYATLESTAGDLFVYELAQMFCSDWLEFSAFCSEVLLCLLFSFFSFFFLQLAELLGCREPCFLISARLHRLVCAC